MHNSQCWLNWHTCFLLPLSYDTLWRRIHSHAHTHTHTHHMTCSSFPSPLRRESDGARSNANWVKCSGKWLFPLGLLNSSSELALSPCVCVCVCACVCVTALALAFVGVRATIVLHVLEYMKVCTPGCVWECVCACVFIPISPRLPWATDHLPCDF